MSEKAKPAEQQAQADAESTTASKGSMMGKLMIGGFIGIVALAETLIFFLMVPSAEEVAALAEAKVLQRVQESMEQEQQEARQDENELVDFPLGEYGISFIPPGSDRSYRVEFQLFGTVRVKDKKKLEAIYAKKSATFQHRIMLEVRNATIDELMENQLGLIQRRLLATSNEVLSDDQPLILGVSLPGYTVMEE